MTTLLLLSLPWGYLIAGLFLLLAIILFIVAIFMKDTGENYDEELETRRYKKKEKEDYEASYEDTFDRYQNVTETMEPEDTLQDMIAETSEDLAETRMFTPVVDIPEPELYEETVQDAEPEAAEEVFTEEAFAAPEATFADFAEAEDVAEPEAEVEPEEVPLDDEDEFEEMQPKKKRFSRNEDADMDEVPKPVAKQKSGMSFAEEVRRLIEEEEKKKK